MARIGIVGAGPGGISLARLLRDRGQNDIVIFERTDRVGGKSFSYEYAGLMHEMGTCYLADNYIRLHKWFRECGLGLFNLRKSVLVRPDGSVMDFREYVRDSSKLSSLRQFLAYTWHWSLHYLRRRTGWDRAAFNRESALRYEDWLLERDLPLIFRFAVRAVTVMGYGSLSDVPALTGLAWVTPGLILGAARSNTSEPALGWGTLWQRMAAHMDVRLSTNIHRATRTAGGGYRIETNKGTEEVDHLVITCPLDECSWIDLPVEVRALAREIIWRDYMSTLIVAQGWFRDADTRFFETIALSAAGSGIGRLMGARRTGDKVPGLPATRPDVYVTYQYANPSISSEQLLENLKQDVAADGGRVTEVVLQKRWKYGPALKPEAIMAGAIQRREDIQGKGNLWYSGASFSHEAVINIADFNDLLAERMVRAIKQRAPAPVTRAAAHSS